jgi:hypothetical protein
MCASDYAGVPLKELVAKMPGTRSIKTFLIVIWLAILPPSGAILVDLEKSKAGEKAPTMLMPGECLRACSDDYDEKVARCKSLPRSRDRNACITQANQARGQCRYECAEPR